MFDSIKLEEEVEDMIHTLNASCEYIRDEPQFESLDKLSGPSPKPSIEETPKLDFRPLTSHLHYAYLGCLTLYL